MGEPLIKDNISSNREFGDDYVVHGSESQSA
jgi:hypothetical protein